MGFALLKLSAPGSMPNLGNARGVDKTRICIYN